MRGYEGDVFLNLMKIKGVSFWVLIITNKKRNSCEFLFYCLLRDFLGYAHWEKSAWSMSPFSMSAS